MSYPIYLTCVSLGQLALLSLSRLLIREAQGIQPPEVQNMFLRLRTIIPAIVVSTLGMWFSMVSDFTWIREVVDGLLQTWGVQFTTKTHALGWLALIFWAVTSSLLFVAPVVKNNRVYRNLEVNMIFSSYLPFLLLGWPFEVVLRGMATIWLICTLCQIAGLPLKKTFLNILNPWYWFSILRGKEGAIPAAMLSSEFLGGGKCFIGDYPMIGTIFMLVSCLALARSTWISWKKEGDTIAPLWFVHCSIYVVGMTIKLGYLIVMMLL